MAEEHNHTDEHQIEDDSQSEPVGHKALADALSVSFRALKWGMGLLIILYLVQGFFFADTDEVKIKLRFGRPVKVSLGQNRPDRYVIDAASGWHYAWPWEEVVTVPLSEKSLEIEGAFAPARRRSGGGKQGLSPKMDNYLLTGDVNIIYMQLQARYRPRTKEGSTLDYVFRMRPPEAKTGTEQIPAPADLLRRLVIDATIETVSTWGVLDVRDKTKEVPVGAGKGMKSLQLFDQIEKRVREKLRQFEQKNGFSIGINLVGIERIGDPEVPAAVRPAFDMFQQAESQKDRLTDEGTEKANSVKASARGRKAEIIAEAKAYKSRIQNIARADAQMLTQLSRVYKESPVKASILREWHYQRMLEELLGEARGSFVLHETKDETSRELWLQMSQPPKPEKKEKSGEGPEE